MLDPRYPCISPASADPHSIPLRHKVDELARELDMRRRVYPGRVQKGRMTPQREQEEIDGLAAIWHDLHHLENFEGLEPAQYRIHSARRKAELVTFPWAVRVALLRREIDMRRRKYPEWIEKGTLTPHDAKQRLERMEAVHFDYWRHAHHFMPIDLQHLLRDPGPFNGPGCKAFRAAARAHDAQFDPHGNRGEYIDGAGQGEQQATLAFA